MEVLGGELIILNLPSPNFPTQMYMYCDSINGYVDNNGDPTHIVAIYRIRQLIPCIVGSVVTYTLIYSVLDTVAWPVGTNNRVLAFTFGDDGGAY